MSKLSKIVLGLLSIVPLLYAFVFAAFIVSMFFGFAVEPQPAGSGPPLIFLIFMVAHLGIIFLCLALTAFYVVYLFRTDKVDEGTKALWAVVLFLGNMGAFPVFWYLYVWRKPQSKPL